MLGVVIAANKLSSSLPNIVGIGPAKPGSSGSDTNRGGVPAAGNQGQNIYPNIESGYWHTDLTVANGPFGITLPGAASAQWSGSERRLVDAMSLPFNNVNVTYYDVGTSWQWLGGRQLQDDAGNPGDVRDHITAAI